MQFSKLNPLSLLLVFILLALSYSSVEAQSSQKAIALAQLKVAKQQLPQPSFEEKRPSTDELKDWQNKAEYGVWLDNKKIDNSELAKKQPSDFGWFDVSRLMKNAVNYGKHSYQISLYSKAYYDKHLKNKKL